jgi:hypothetical protein
MTVPQDWRIDLLDRVPSLRRIGQSRTFQPAVTLVTLSVLVLAILTGILGTPVGNRNFSTVMIWIVWWTLLIIVLVPLLGRAWCAICPIPAPGEWLQRRAIIRRAPGRLRTLRWHWPTYLKNGWLQNLSFLVFALFSVMILTRPAITAWILLAFVVASLVLSALYENRAFCRYICPVGGFVSLYSLAAPVELRVGDPQVCATHSTKDCITGSPSGYGCPWMAYPGQLTRNADCGMCLECLKTCPKDNIVINLRPFGSDLRSEKNLPLDEVFRILLLLGCAIVYPLVLLGPDGWLKESANMISALDWGAYALFFLAFNLLILPGLFWLVTALSKIMGGQQASFGALFADYVYALVPLGLAAWVAFSLDSLLVQASYALNVLSDPFGWGWNLFGTANAPWTPAPSALVSALQIGALTAGLLLATTVSFRSARQQSHSHRRAWLATLPLAGFMLLITLALLALYAG